jgi:2-methylisocitrate lyase-like PEP mutase family enzyme
MPNPWDAGSAVLLESLGFEALATTSSGSRRRWGRLDGGVTRDEAIEHARTVAEAVSVPVSADLENCFADEPEAWRRPCGWPPRPAWRDARSRTTADPRHDTIYDAGLAAERRPRGRARRPAPAPGGFVLTARAENHVHGRDDLADTIARLQSYQEGGADVLFAPGHARAVDIRELVRLGDLPVNVLVLPECRA